MKSYLGQQTILDAIPEILYDESRFASGVPDAAYFPQTIDDVRHVVVEAHRMRKPITLIGGKTGVAGGCVPINGCIALCFSDMNRITRLEENAEGLLLHCDPGVTLSGIETFLADPSAQSASVAGASPAKPGIWLYPPDPTESSAQLGGTIATNASGARSYRFGPTRKHVEGITVVLANGDTLTLKRDEHAAKNGVFAFSTDQGTAFTIAKPSYRSPSVKNASGYFSADAMDLVDFFIGSEGTLGIIVHCTVRLMVRPRFAAGLSFFPNRSSAFKAGAFLRTQDGVSAIEYFDQSAMRLLASSRNELAFDLPELPAGKPYAVYWEYLDEAASPFENRMDEWESVLAACGSSFESTWSGFEAKEIDRLKAMRHAVPEAVNNAVARYKRDCPDIRKISTDTALPAEQFERVYGEYESLIESSGLEHAVFGHLGDFHLHVNLMPRTPSELAIAKSVYDRIMGLTVAGGGTVSAEHGIGKLKTGYLRMMYGDAGR